MVDLRVEFHLPGLTVAADKVEIKMPRRRGRRVGPLLIVSRASGLALDTALHRDPGTRVIGYRQHSARHQLWYLSASGRKGEVVIASAENGFVLDCDRESSDPHLLQREAEGEPWQSWTVEAAPDGIGHTIRSSHSRYYLALGDEAEERWSPWFAERKLGFTTQWVISQPLGPI